MTAAATRVCFVIAPIGESAREWSNPLLNYVIKPAVEQLGFIVVRADLIAVPGPILDQITELLVRADLVIADVTDRNPNVFYEIGVRHAIGRPIVHLARTGETLPFDVAGMRTIFVDISTADTLGQAVNDLRSAADNALRQRVATPISQRFRVTIVDDNQPLFGEHLAQAILACLSTAAEPHRIATPATQRKRYFVEAPTRALASLEGLPKSAIDLVLLLMERLADGSAVGTETGRSQPPGRVVRIRRQTIDNVDVPDLSIYYVVNDDRIVLHGVETEPEV